MRPYEKHVFVCVHRRPPGHPKGCCAEKGSEEIRDLFKAELKKRGLLGRMRPNAAGCLDACAEGPAVVVYPDGVWYRVETAEHVREIVDAHLVGGEPVEHLRLRPSPPSD